MRKLTMVLLAAMIATAACGGHPILSAGPGSGQSQSSLGGTHPNVLQGGAVPINWTQFTPSTPSLNYFGIVAGPDKNMWFIDAGDALLVKMTMAGTTTTFSLNGFAAYAMAVGADQRFYFVEDHGTKID